MPTELEVAKSPRVPRYRPCRRRLRSWLDFTEHDRARSPLHARESLSMLCLSDRSLCSRHRLPVSVTLGFIFFYKRLENRKEGGKQTTWKARPLLFPSRHRNMADRLTVSVPRQWVRRSTFTKRIGAEDYDDSPWNILSRLVLGNKAHEAARIGARYLYFGSASHRWRFPPLLLRARVVFVESSDVQSASQNYFEFVALSSLADLLLRGVPRWNAVPLIYGSQD